MRLKDLPSALGSPPAIGEDAHDHAKPFDIASHALPTHIPAQRYDLGLGSFVWTGGDRHSYANHLEQARLQPGLPPRLEILRRPEAIDGYEAEDFVVHDYAAQAHMKAPVAV